MTTNDKEYELHILRKVINNYLDEVVEFSEDSLNSLLSKHDDMVWKIATKIYSQSGYKVEFSFVRDVLNSWIEVLKERIAGETIKLAEQAQIQAERQAEQARIKAGWQAKQPVIQAGWQAEQARIQAKRQAEQTRIEAERQLELTRQLEASASDNKKTELFEKVKKIIVDQLCVESDRVTLSSHISNDLGADECDTDKLVIALEEEFDIEIPDDNSLLGSEKNFRYDYATHRVSWCLSGDGYRPVACTVEKLVEYIHQRISEQNLS